MPFAKQNSRAFDRTSVLALNPAQQGVYGLFRSGQWIYVGKGDIRGRLLDHLNGDNDCITGQGPTHFLAEVTALADTREKELILELRPVCNERVG